MTVTSPALATGSFGEHTPPLKVGPFVVSMTRHPCGLILPKHAHERASLNVVLGGAYAENVRGSTVTHPPFSLVVKPPGETHSNDFRRVGARCLLIEIASLDQDLLEEAGTLFEASCVLPTPDAVGTAIRIAGILRHSGPMTIELLDSFVYDLIAATGSEGNRVARIPPPWLRQVRDHLRDLDGRPISLATIATIAGRHPLHLAREFRRFFRVSVGEFARRLRLARAAQALASTERSIGEIGIDAGFYDHSHFSRHFHRLTGMTPSDFRNLAG